MMFMKCQPKFVHTGLFGQGEASETEKPVQQVASLLLEH
jgi:hypothetical protein